MANEEVNEKKVQMLKQIAEYYRITRNIDFANFFGLSAPTAFSRIKNGYIDFEEVYRRCPDISADWLLSEGEGPMLRKDRDKEIFKRMRGEMGDTPVAVTCNDDLKAAMNALAKEQEALARSQEHISGLIDVLSKK